MKLTWKILFILIFNILFAENYTGYLRTAEVSFCMDTCSQYYIESETGEYIDNISFVDFINPELYINRYVYVEGSPIWCVECGALLVEEISISDECLYPVSCFADPCEVAGECQLNTPVECIPNYCGGCFADFYDLESNLVDCNASEVVEECYDVGDLFFGMCDMYMGVAVSNGECQGVSGCGWIIDGIDYSDAFFESFDECEHACINEPYSCEDIEYEYGQLHSGEYSGCELDLDCIAVWGDCGIGLGGCHYAVNEENYPFYQINSLVNDWATYNCEGGVCDCMDLPNVICNDGYCELAYCYNENPVGCFNAGCPVGYECVDDPNNCTPTSCFCDDSSWYGNWYCTEDCGGGTCVAILNGDVNQDGELNVSDIIIVVNMILGLIDVSLDADMNNDNIIDIIDVVMIIDDILNI